MTGHRYANMIDARGWPFKTYAILDRGAESLTVQAIGPDGQPNSEPRPISAKAPLRLYASLSSAYAARGMHCHHTE